ncbi:hypothetical protein QA802_30665 [Streptomyces sp. B21-105]|uniref:hypothetical protein n=1 Tax=Streptomyces sp. B21-105 TaxID=3039417 RepID=UPI002FF2A3DB
MYRAKETFWAPGNRRIAKGDLVAPDDVVVEGREELFEAVVIPQAMTPAQAADARKASVQDADAASGGDDGDSTPEPAPDGGDPPAAAPAAKKTTAKKTTASRTPAGGDGK